MKIAVLSDIHGNVPALEAVLEDIERWGADEIVVNGDLVNRGPNSLACVRLLQRRVPQCRLLKGNHEEFVLSTRTEAPAPDARTYDLWRFPIWTAEQLGPLLDEMALWHDQLELEGPAGGTVHITHGSRLGNRDGIRPETSDEELEAKLGQPGELFIASHTHRPLVRQFNGTRVVNVGSVGAPFDGDPRAAYGQFTFRDGRWQAQIVRVAYDRARAERHYRTTGFLDGGGPLAQLMLLELRHSRGYVGRWMHHYYRAVEEGEMTVSAAVEAFLRTL